MNSKHRKILNAIFSSSASRSIPFRDIEALLKAVGCVVEENEGSRVEFVHAEKTWSTHRPHPGKEAKSYHIKRVREFLQAIGVNP